MADSKPVKLDVIQRWLQSVIVHPGGVEAGIDAAYRRGDVEHDVQHIEQLIGRSQSQTSIARLEVYSNAYKGRLIEVLLGEYPALVHALGEEAFVGLASLYLEHHPPTSYTLAELGRHFPEHLARTRPPKDHENDLPDWADFLIDLARLERIYSEIFDGPGIENLPSLKADVLREISPDQWADTRLVPAPCLRLASFRFPVHAYATAVRQQRDPDEIVAEITHLAIHRRDYIVRRVELSESEFQLVSSLVAGRTIGQALEELIAAHPGQQFDPSTINDWFRNWAAAGFFIGTSI